MRLPYLTAAIGALLLIVSLTAGWLVFRTLMDDVIHNRSNEQLIRESTIAQQTFDKKVLQVFMPLQSQAYSASMQEAIRQQDDSAIVDALLGIYDQEALQSNFDYLFLYLEEDDRVVHAQNYAGTESREVLQRVDDFIDTVIKSYASEEPGFDFLKHGHTPFLILHIPIPNERAHVFGVLSFNRYPAMLAEIAQHTNSRCVGLYLQKRLVASSSEHDTCRSQLAYIAEKPFLMRESANDLGLVRNGASKHDTFFGLDIGLVIDQAVLSHFHQQFRVFSYAALFLLSAVLLTLLLVMSRFIGSAVNDITRYAKHALSDQNARMPVTKVVEFNIIAQRFDSLIQSLRNEINQRTRTEKQLSDSNKMLTMKSEEADAANKEKGQFLANMSHEIRTPLNSIINLARITLDSSLDSTQHRHLSRVFHSSQALLRLIDDLLDFSKIEAGTLDIESKPFQLDETISLTRGAIAPKLESKDVRFIIDMEWGQYNNLVGDALRLQQILINLCDNAIKFTDHGDVTLSVRKAEGDDRQITLQFRVTDTGIGISEKNRKKIFEAFSQVDSSVSRKYGGAGLGLPIVTRFVDIMGGTIRAKSKLGKGSTFVVELPFGISLPNTSFSTKPFQNKSVLLACDQPEILSILASMLDAFKMLYETVSSAEELVHHISNGQDELLLFNWFDSTDIKELAKLGIVTEDISYKELFIRALLGDEENISSTSPTAQSYLMPVTLSELYDALVKFFGPPLRSQSSNIITTSKEALFSHLKGKHILIVEDNPTNQEITQILLEQLSIETDIANNGEEGVKKVLAHEYDLVLMDIQMPKMDGLEATRIIRKTYSSSELQIVGLTAHAMQQHADACREAGMDAHISKPIDPDKLYHIISALLSVEQVTKLHS